MEVPSSSDVTVASPLSTIHEKAGGEFQPYADVQIVSTYGQTPLEYAAFRRAAALMDAAQRGILEVRGKDRLEFLNRLLTNQTFDKETKTPLAAGRGVYCFLLNVKGRILADMNVLELGDRAWLEMDRRLIPAVAKTLDGYLFGEDVKLAPSALHLLGCHGPKAFERVGQVASATLQLAEPLQSQSIVWLGQSLTAWREDSAGVPGVFLAVPADLLARAWEQLIAVGCRPAGWGAFNAVRIEAGRPIFGVDFDDTLLPAETGQLSRAVSFTKGCYVGQEIVARMHARQQVAKQLVGIRMAGEEMPIAGAQIFDDVGNTVGGVTSSTISPVLSNVALCLALVKKPFFATGTELKIPAEGAMRLGKVVELPFVPLVG